MLINFASKEPREQILYQLSPQGVVLLTALWFLQWKDAQKLRKLGSVEVIINNSALFTWKPLPVGWIKLNTDVAVFNTKEEYGIGWLARDENGGLIEARISYKKGRVGVLEAG